MLVHAIRTSNSIQSLSWQKLYCAFLPTTHILLFHIMHSPHIARAAASTLYSYRIRHAIAPRPNSLHTHTHTSRWRVHKQLFLKARIIQHKLTFALNGLLPTVSARVAFTWCASPIIPFFFVAFKETSATNYRLLMLANTVTYGMSPISLGAIWFGLVFVNHSVLPDSARSIVKTCNLFNGVFIRNQGLTV